MTIEDPDAYLRALEEARAERAQMHPHAPVLPPERHLRSVPTSSADRPAIDAPPENLEQHDRLASPFALDPQTIELGRRRLAEMRALIARHHTEPRRPA